MVDWAPRDTQAYQRELEVQGRAPTTVNRQLATLRRFARWASEQPGATFAGCGLPTRGIAALATDEPGCKKLERHEMHALFKAADELVYLDRNDVGERRRSNARPRRNRAILALLYYTGLRVSEQVVLEPPQLQGNHLVNVARKGRSRTRRAYLVAGCRRLLDDYLEHERSLDDPAGTARPLFLSTDVEGTRGGFLGRSAVARLLGKIAQHAGTERGDIALHPHRLRHTFGALHRERPLSDTETAAALGHTSLQYVGRFV